MPSDDPKVKFTNRELQACAERELALRRNVYKRLGWSTIRAREINLMSAIAEHFKDLAEGDDLAEQNFINSRK